ncbi:septal ring lytic transglycosylase RlpA family protein [Chitinivorax sp. B]|uniref:septal ring lytic transglycosylase RlpA family protein n=1 Tax=Chitinivorax sp. B TaxID=2502235 RepID=UPI0020171E96|nr:septal ring lytic transglycosylase RlpA family protein [Chitinivorax sp. B]
MIARTFFAKLKRTPVEHWAGYVLICLAAALIQACTSLSGPQQRQGNQPPVAVSMPNDPFKLPPTTSTQPVKPGKNGGAYYKDDGPPDSINVDLDKIPEPKPKDEPLHKYANRPYSRFGEEYVPAKEHKTYKAQGTASWYGRKFHGKRTSSGELYDMLGLSAAHPTLPIPSYARVTNLENGKSVVVRVNDRGPFHKGRLMDLSYAAAHRLGYAGKGHAKVEVEAITPDQITELASRGELPRGPGARVVAEQAETVVAVLNDTGPILSETLPPQTEETMVSGEVAEATNVFLQVGVFRNKTNAESMRSKVLTGWQEADDSKVNIVSKEGMFRLQIGPFASEQQAREAVGRLKDKLALSAVVVR